MSDIIHNETLFNSFLYYSLTFIPNSLSSRFKPSISVLFSKVGLRIEIETFGFDFFALRLGRHERCGTRYCVLIVELHGFHIFGAGIRRIFVTGREHGANGTRRNAHFRFPATFRACARPAPARSGGHRLDRGAAAGCLNY